MARTLSPALTQGRGRMRGVAAITAILIVAVAASAATMMLAQQSAMIDQTLMVGARAQADLYAQAGLDWARGVLAQDARNVDSPNEGWAQPIAALPVDRALVAGGLADEQGKFNLNNLVQNNNQRSEPDVRVFRALLKALALPEELAEAVIDWVDQDDALSGNGGAESAYYLALAMPYRPADARMMQVEELYRVRGFDAKTVARLRPHVTALPERSAVNVNTASDVVLGALLDMPPDRLGALLAERRAKPYAKKDDFTAAVTRAGGNAGAITVDHDVKSAFFLAQIRVSQDAVHLATEALIRRPPNQAPAIVWRRARH